MKNSEIFFDGEKYISSKQASLIGNYTSDYIGQLCRSGKVNARRFGRDWFVSEKSLLDYQHSIAILYPQEPKLVIADAKKIEPSRLSRDDWDSILLETNTISRINEKRERRQVSAWKKILVMAGLVLATNLLTWNSPKILNNLSQIKKDTVFALASDIGGWAKSGAALPTPSFIDLPFSVQDLIKNSASILSILGLPANPFLEKIGGEISSFLFQDIPEAFFALLNNLETLSQTFLARKPAPTMIAVNNFPIHPPLGETPRSSTSDVKSPKTSDVFPRDVEGGGIINKILLRLASIESKLEGSKISQRDLDRMNNQILLSFEETLSATLQNKINSALLGIESRIPPISPNPVVFITQSAPSPYRNEPPQQVSGITSGFGSFSQGIGTAGDLTASGNVSLGSEGKTVSFTSKNWNITSSGLVSGLSGITTTGTTSLESLSVSSSGTSTFSGGISAGGLASSNGLTLTGGSLLNTSSASSSFSNGINLSGGCFSVNGSCVGSGIVGQGTSGQFPFFASSGTTLTATSSLFLATSGNVGVGTTSPGSLFSLSGIGNFNAGTSTLYTGLNLSLINATSTVASSTIRMLDTAGLSSSNGFTITGGNLLYPSANFVLGSNGRLGVGTTSPGSILSVVGASQFTGTSTFQGIIATSTALLATNGGRVGIGTTSPNWLLQVAGTRPFFTLSDTSAGTDLKHWYMSSQGGSFYVGTTTDLYATTTGYQAFTILNNGSVGIGTTSPTAELSISNGTVTIDINPGGATGFIGTNTNHDLSIGTVNSGRMTVTTTGNVGIGTTSPGSLFSLGDTGNNTINISPTATSTFGSGLNIRTGCFAVNGTCVGDVKYSDARYEMVTATKNLADATGATQAITGCGFAPKAVMAHGNVSNTSMAAWGFAENNGTAEGNSINTPYTAAGGSFTTVGGTGTVDILTLYTTGTPDAQKAAITSWDSDGFTITWTKQNSPSGTADLYFMCMR